MQLACHGINSQRAAPESFTDCAHQQSATVWHDKGREPIRSILPERAICRAKSDAKPARQIRGAEICALIDASCSTQRGSLSSESVLPPTAALSRSTSVAGAIESHFRGASGTADRTAATGQGGPGDASRAVTTGGSIGRGRPRSGAGRLRPALGRTCGGVSHIRVAAPTAGRRSGGALRRRASSGAGMARACGIVRWSAPLESS
jgi:hypothetical protein